ncbi:MAG: RNA polymerase subunit sigma-70 [Acidobacteria bacterium]|nr:MAG: RNA polymerase subunit sigma-70 [Acidobacteriota bacterium]PYV68197.1 MAG: RNA polymerase subunit sigma-70 [Acidobacteriota bacterium]
MNKPSIDVTLLLKKLSSGNQDVLAELIPLVYDELRRLAAYHLRQERSNHTLQATALVHEAYLRLVDQHHVDWKNRSHFFGVAAHLMRRILLMHARQHHAAKRGGSAQKVSLDEAVIFTRERSAELVALDELLTRLAELDPQQARIVELRFFGGLSVEETADLLGISTATVKRDWAMAKAWLARELGWAANRETASG